MNHKKSTVMNHIAVMVLTGTLPLGSAQARGIRQEKNSSAPARSREMGTARLCTARLIYINVRTEYMNGEALERELLKRAEFRRWGMAITRKKEEAELIVEVTRKKFTTRFSISIIDADTDFVIAADSASSIGGTIEPKLADRFIKQVKTACERS